MFRSQTRRSHRRFAAFVAAYVAIAVGGLAILREPAKYELFPFSAWPLFMITPADGAEYGLRFETDGDVAYLDEVIERNRIEAYTVTQSLGRAIEREDASRRDELIGQLRRRYFDRVPEGATVEVIHRSFDPLIVHAGGGVDGERVVARFRR